MKINSLTLIIFTVATTIVFSSCEHERLEPVTTTADGGGTISSFLAYNIDSVGGQSTNIYGRVVFYKDNANNTLVQLALYNTMSGSEYPVSIVSGAKGSETEEILSLYDIKGDTGEFGESKFYVIGDPDYFSSISAMDAHINVYLSEDKNTIAASGDFGVNNDPVESE
ncbi:hypothetical protein [Fulvivirga ligni]|uniref:hypothetical protein n=1 Tax=Fulvivirga ligni TaxID=2904246 RepID=UPI001F2E2D97|nr:hypothetical protein [Fulvivirga ligni]UII22864.1 hypothetical protein LVD16_06465 [Fulvivirga ligni]